MPRPFACDPSASQEAARGQTERRHTSLTDLSRHLDGVAVLTSATKLHHQNLHLALPRPRRLLGRTIMFLRLKGT